MLPLVLTLLLERLVIKEPFQSQWIIILAKAHTASLVPSYKVDGWPLADITFRPSPGPFFRGCLGKQSLGYSRWCHREDACSNASASKSGSPALDLCTENCHYGFKKKKESVLLYLWRNQKHVLFTGCIFRELVHLVHSCQNRVRKGQQINVRESASLHKSPTSSRETPSWPRRAFQSGDMSQ